MSPASAPCAHGPPGEGLGQRVRSSRARRSSCTASSTSMDKGATRIAGILRTVLDVLVKDLQVLFVGSNPSLRSAEVGHNFARPGNRFYPALHAAGFTPRRLRPDEDR